jgi:ATP synthase protein I
LRFVGIGTELVATVLLGVALGWWLDRRFGTKPWCLTGGAFLGAVAGMINYVRRVMRSGSSGTGTP